MQRSPMCTRTRIGTAPEVTPRKKLVLDSIVIVVVPEEG